MCVTVIFFFLLAFLYLQSCAYNPTNGNLYKIVGEAMTFIFFFSVLFPGTRTNDYGIYFVNIELHKRKIDICFHSNKLELGKVGQSVQYVFFLFFLFCP